MKKGFSPFYHNPPFMEFLLNRTIYVKNFFKIFLPDIFWEVWAATKKKRDASNKTLNFSDGYPLIENSVPDRFCHVGFANMLLPFKVCYGPGNS